MSDAIDKAAVLWYDYTVQTISLWLISRLDLYTYHKKELLGLAITPNAYEAGGEANTFKV